jgi:hypothetical protein
MRQGLICVSGPIRAPRTAARADSNRAPRRSQAIGMPMLIPGHPDTIVLLDQKMPDPGLSARGETLLIILAMQTLRTTWRLSAVVQRCNQFSCLLEQRKAARS